MYVYVKNRRLKKANIIGNIMITGNSVQLSPVIVQVTAACCSLILVGRVPCTVRMQYHVKSLEF